MCSLKTLHGLEPPARYDAKHYRSTSIANGLKALKEKLVVDGKQKKQSKPSRKKRITQSYYLLLSRKEVVPVANE
jgi:hypothetical protein